MPQAAALAAQIGSPWSPALWCVAANATSVRSPRWWTTVPAVNVATSPSRRATTSPRRKHTLVTGPTLSAGSR